MTQPRRLCRPAKSGITRSSKWRWTPTRATDGVSFKAPVKGVLQNLHAQVDQQVPAGAILFDVAEMDPIWVKVSVYVGDLERLAVDRPAGVGSLADPPGVKVRAAQPVTAPPSGDPLAATVHLYYQVENHDQPCGRASGSASRFP